MESEILKEYYTANRACCMLGIERKELRARRGEFTTKWKGGWLYVLKKDVDMAVEKRSTKYKLAGKTADQMIEELKQGSIKRWHQLCEQDRVTKHTDEQISRMRAENAVTVVRTLNNKSRL